jgi:small subunit ribosomal protein S5
MINKNPRRQQTDRVPAKVVEWKPVTTLGQDVKSGAITSIGDVFAQGHNILEAEIVSNLLPDLEEDLLLIGQAKGKFGGGQRRIFRQTQKKTREGNKIQFMTCAVVGNKNGYVGVGLGKSKETVPARDKAKRRARLNLMRIRRGCGSWETDSREANSIPFSVTGKCGSVRITLFPAPRGKGLCVEKECAKILRLAGITDILSKTEGQTKTKLNLINALLDALKKLSEVKLKPEDIAKLGVVDGEIKGTEVVPEILDPAAIIAESDEIVNVSGEAIHTSPADSGNLEVVEETSEPMPEPVEITPESANIPETKTETKTEVPLEVSPVTEEK